MFNNPVFWLMAMEEEGELPTRRGKINDIVKYINTLPADAVIDLNEICEAKNIELTSMEYEEIVRRTEV